LLGTSETVYFVPEALSPEGMHFQLQDMYCAAVLEAGREGRGMELL